LRWINTTSHLLRLRELGLDVLQGGPAESRTLFTIALTCSRVMVASLDRPAAAWKYKP
jgi:hypothetical protein